VHAFRLCSPLTLRLAERAGQRAGYERESRAIVSGCVDLVRELAAVTGPSRSSELIYFSKPDGPLDPGGFARADHCDQIHWGMDG
jgi:hypothetical protein